MGRVKDHGEGAMGWGGIGRIYTLSRGPRRKDEAGDQYGKVGSSAEELQRRQSRRGRNRSVAADRYILTGIGYVQQLHRER